MTKDETLTIMMDYPTGSEHWDLEALLGAAYSVSEAHYMCTMNTCTVAWDITYSSTNNFGNKATINSTLYFDDLVDNSVDVGLRITEAHRMLGAVGGLSECTRIQEVIIGYAGAPLI